jgi:RHS repeat-associated protein
VNGALVEGFPYEGQLRPVAWLDGTGAVYATFVYGLHVNVPEYMVTAAGTFRFLTDHLGSPRLVVNASTGAVAQRIDYDEWGQVTSDTSPGFQPFGFAGGLYDRDTGLVRFGARDYDASTGRWTSKDPLSFGGGDSNLYAYAANDPVNVTDPTGLADDGRTLWQKVKDWLGLGPMKYMDLNFAFGAGPGVTAGVVMSTETGKVNFYAGVGFMTSPGVALTCSAQSVTPGWNFGVQGGYGGGSVQAGLAPDGTAFVEGGVGTTGAAVTGYWIDPEPFVNFGPL